MEIDSRDEMTVKQFAASRKGKWPTERTLRKLILDAAWGKNSFQSAFIRVGGTVLVKPSEFWKCVDAIQEK